MAEIWPDVGLDAVLAIFPKGGSVPANTYLALFTAFTGSTVGTASQGQSSYTEPSGNAYARQAIASGSWGAQAAATGGRSVSAAQVTFPTATGTWGTLNGSFLCAAVSGATTAYFAGNFDDLSPVTINNGGVIKVTPMIVMNS